MNIRCHYPTGQLPHKFVPWIDLTDPRFGIDYPHKATSEISILLEELWLHNSELCLWLAQLGIPVYSIRMFRSRPNRSYQLHIDVDPTDSAWVTPLDADLHVYDQIIKLNFIYHSHSSTMTWYTLKEGCTAHTHVNHSGYTSLSFDQEDCDQIHHTSCDTDCLINGGRIHTLTNSDNNGSFRLCYSLFLQNNSFTITWDQAVDILRPWLGE